MKNGIKSGAVVISAILGFSALTFGQDKLAAKSAQPQSQTGTTLHPGAATSGDMQVLPGTTQEISSPDKQTARIAKEVRHELAMLPYYTLFDDLRFRVNGASVTLSGSVINSVLKSDAESAVKRIEGVEQVSNNINVLPPSPMDDRIRHETARAIFSFGDLSRYSWEAAPTIHIIVNAGHVTLTGVVDSESDKNAAGIRAQGVPGVFSVDNELLVTRK